jgi:hypothetical protein
MMTRSKSKSRVASNHDFSDDLLLFARNTLRHTLNSRNASRSKSKSRVASNHDFSVHSDESDTSSDDDEEEK